jgi:hypothetical protein
LSQREKYFYFLPLTFSGIDKKHKGFLSSGSPKKKKKKKNQKNSHTLCKKELECFFPVCQHEGRVTAKVKGGHQ